MSAEKLREAAERVLQYPIDQGCAGHKQFAQDLKLAADACTTLAAQMEHKGEQYERWRKRDGMQGISEVAQRQERCAYYAGYEAATAQMQAKLDAAKAQLPAGMQECTIEFRACPVGHGRLMATNWTDHGCLVCERDAANERVKELEAEAKDWQASFTLYDNALRRGTSLYNNAHTDNLKSLPDTASMIQWLCDALATAERERELLRKEVRRCWELADKELGPPSDFCVYCDAQREDRPAEVRALVGTTADIKDT